jgi:hypothetical protein
MGTSLDPVPGNIEASAAPSEQDDAAKLPALVEELIKTEKSYISRIRALKLVRNTVQLHWPQAYADPLRNFSKRADHMIIPPYEAKIIFANIDAVVHAAETFFQDLAGATVETVGAVCLQHVGFYTASRSSSSATGPLSRTEYTSASRTNPSGSSKTWPRSTPHS